MIDAVTALAMDSVVLRQLRREEIATLALALAGDPGEAQLKNRWREQQLGYRELLVAEVDGSLVGTVSIGETELLPRALHLFALEVAPAWRNRGVGTAIVQRVVAEARRRRRGRVYLEVRVDNPARRLYHRLGFRRMGGPFVNPWWRYLDDGRQERVEELSYRMVRRVTTRD
ncbi:MAG TPA: GNAT family N-acetyltransferase [Dehalococcoidia bacterium]|nr:GNAT family N-acetyltransferase [Dehalococcoidia bacterium]